MEDVIVAIMVDDRPSLHGEALLWDKLKEYLSGKALSTAIARSMAVS